jgi:diadenosine tetraphosphate (Ap4A) HIT family hydrolase
VKIHPQLEQDCIVIGHFALCVLLLMRDANYPWFILVPERDDISEIHQLDQQDQIELVKESSELARFLSEQFAADKLNIAALGNVVPQLHIHHIVRYRNDAAWPGPVWGKVAAKAYTDTRLRTVIAKFEQANMAGFEFVAQDT